MTINNEINVFKADYNYGPVEERLVQRYRVTNFLGNLTSKLYAPLVYPGAVKKFDEERTSLSINQLKAIGGKSVSMRTPDGALLDGIHIKAQAFKASIEKYLTLVSIENNSNGFQEMTFTLKPEFCSVKKEGRFFPTYTYTPSDTEAIQFLEYLEKLRFGQLSFNQPLPSIRKDKDISESTKLVKYLESFFYEKLSGVNFRLFALSQKVEELRSVNEEIASNPTVLISGGNGGLYIFYKTLAALYLIRGLDVMLADYRGYGNSSGTPNSYNTKLDLETIYQYLSKENNVVNKDILLHAHCMGAGSATDLAARRSGVNILVDRSFANMNDLAKEDIELHIQDMNFFSKENAERLTNVAAKALNLFVDYDNATNLNKIKGEIVLVRADNDDVIPEEQFEKQLDSIEKKIKVIHTQVGHNDLWIAARNNSTSNLETHQFNAFLITNNFYRKMFELVSPETNIAA